MWRFGQADETRGDKKRTQTRLKCTNLETIAKNRRDYFQSFGDVLGVKRDTKDDQSTKVDSKKEVCEMKQVHAETEEFQPRKSADYEVLASAYFSLVLNSSHKVTNFTLRSSVDGLIIDVDTSNGSKHHFAFRLKHKDAKLSQKSFESEGDFNIEEYRKSSKCLEDFEKFHLVFYTNAKLNLKEEPKSAYKVVPRERKSKDDSLQDIEEIFKTSSTEEELYRFELTDDQLTTDQQFYSQFTLYPSQNNVEGFEESLLEILEDSGSFLKYINLFKMCHRGRFTSKTMDKETLNIHIVDIFFSSFIKSNLCFSSVQNKNLELFERAVETFDVTVIDESMEDFKNQLTECEILENLPDPTKRRLERFLKENNQNSQQLLDPEEAMTNCMLRLAKDYKMVDRDATVLEPEARMKLLHYFFRKPIIVDFNKKSQDLIYLAMGLYRAGESEIKFVFLGKTVDVNRFSHLTVFSNLKNLKSEDFSVYKNVITTCTLSLQGRNISLEKLTKRFEKIEEFVRTSDIFRMLKGKYRIGGEERVLPSNYIHRTVSTTLLNVETVFELSTKTNELLLINFDGRLQHYKDLIHTKRIKVRNLQDYNKPERSTILSTNAEFSKRQFEKFREENKEQNIHFLKLLEGGKMMLVMSTKNTFVRSETPENVEEECHFSNPINILIGQPGMGKSTMLEDLTNRCPTEFWTILVDLKGHNTFFRRKQNPDDVIHRFLKTEDEDILHETLKTSFLERHKIAWFLDGLDEMESRCVDNVLKFVDEASTRGHLVWISSRQSLQEMLELHFNIFALKIEEFSEEEQRQYVHNRLKVEYEAKEVEDIVSKLFKSTDIGNHKKILSVPLQLYVITQIFLDDRQHYSLKENLFTLTKLYKFFYEGRCKDQKIEDPGNILEHYQIAALHSLFGAQIFAKLKSQFFLERNREYLEQLKTHPDPLGIVVKVNAEDKAVFDHLTFAEYFASTFFTKHFEKTRSLRDDFFTEKYRNLLLILNIMNAEDNPLHLAVLYKDLDQVKKFFDNSSPSVDKGGRNLLHLAVCMGERHPHLKQRFGRIEDKHVKAFKGENSTAKEMITFLLNSKIDPLQKDTLFDWNCLNYALASGALYAVEEIMKKCGKYPVLDAIRRYYCRVEIAYYSLRFGYPKLLSAVLADKAFTLRELHCTSLSPLQGNSIVHYSMMAECVDKAGIINTLIGEDYEDSNPLVNSFNKLRKKRRINSAYQGFTLLHFAIIEGDVAAAKLLLNKGARVNAENASALSVAVEYEHVAIVSLLLDNGANPNTQGKFRRTPLFGAASKGNVKIMQLLLSRGAEINATDEDRRTALSYAARKGHLEAATFLVEEGAHFDEATLCDAASGGNVDLIGHLIDEKNLQIDGSNSEGQTPLHSAAQSGKVEAMRFFLERGARADAVTNAGDTVLHLAAKCRRNQKRVMDLLEETPAVGLLNARNRKGATPLHLAIFYENVEAIKVLLERGADVNVMMEGDTILHYAVKCACAFDVIEVLLRRSEVVFLLNVTDLEETTPLHLSVYGGKTDIVRLMLDRGVDLDNIDVNNEEYPLYFATRNNQLQADLLLSVTHYFSKFSYMSKGDIISALNRSINNHDV